MGGKIFPHHFIKKKSKAEKIVMITAYDYFQAKIADEAGVDGILVGDSLGMVVMGYASTLPVTLEEVLHHTKAVLNAKPKALVVADMPFLTYEHDRKEAVLNAGKFIKLGADAVKIEGGVEVADKVEAMVNAGIPVMGHVGLNPQRFLKLGGYKLRGKTAEDAERLIEDAKALEDAGAFSVVIEFTAAEVAEVITKLLKVPTICIGAGPSCDGQILVFHDVVGLNPEPPPFAKQYARTYQVMAEAVRNYVREVTSGEYPSEEHTFRMKPDELTKFESLVKKLK